MPNIENLNKFKSSQSNLLNLRHEDIFHRKDLKDGFGYAVTGVLITLAAAGLVYVVGKQMIK